MGGDLGYPSTVQLGDGSLLERLVRGDEGLPRRRLAPGSVEARVDGSKCLKPGTRKDAQAELIEQQIRHTLPVRGLTDYRLFFVLGLSDHDSLAAVGAVLAGCFASVTSRKARSSQSHSGS